MSAGTPGIVLTRPAEQAAAWLPALRAAGIDAVSLPLLAIADAPDPQAVREAWRLVPDAAFVMFVSANAVARFFAQRPPDTDWPADALAGSSGPGTSAALRDAGVPEHAIVQPSAEQGYDTQAMWSLIDARDWQGRRVLIVRGDVGREWLAERLQDAGAQVRRIAAYRRVRPAWSDTQRALAADAHAHPHRWVWHFSSSESVSHLSALLPQATWHDASAYATHARIERVVRQAGFGRVQTIDPTAQALIAARCAA